MDFNFPLDCKIFQDGCAKGMESFIWSLDISQFKRVTATKYHKDEDLFSIDIEEKNDYGENKFSLDSNETKYYFEWISS